MDSTSRQSLPTSNSSNQDEDETCLGTDSSPIQVNPTSTEQLLLSLALVSMSLELEHISPTLISEQCTQAPELFTFLFSCGSGDNKDIITLLVLLRNLHP